MKDREKIWKKIRKSEQELLAAPPDRAAKLTAKIVKWKAEVFD